MRIRTFKKSTLSLLLTVALVGSYSMVALAGDAKLAGEIVVSGGNDAIVSVNGETVKSGRTVFSSSTIETSADATAFVNVKNVGKLKIAPSSKMLVTFDKDGIAGNIVVGKLTVIESASNVNITAPNGKIATLKTGESVITVQDDDDDDDSGSSWMLWALIFGGAAAAIIIAAASNNNRVDLGGGTTVVSPSI
jgi:hypothetical protein